jgi:hypothetical protein
VPASSTLPVEVFGAGGEVLGRVAPELAFCAAAAVASAQASARMKNSLFSIT